VNHKAATPKSLRFSQNPRCSREAGTKAPRLVRDEMRAATSVNMIGQVDLRGCCPRSFLILVMRTASNVYKRALLNRTSLALYELVNPARNCAGVLIKACIIFAAVRGCFSELSADPRHSDISLERTLLTNP
jgi:hypothetical protein